MIPSGEIPLRLSLIPLFPSLLYSFFGERSFPLGFIARVLERKNTFYFRFLPPPLPYLTPFHTFLRLLKNSLVKITVALPNKDFLTEDSRYYKESPLWMNRPSSMCEPFPNQRGGFRTPRTPSVPPTPSIRNFTPENRTIYPFYTLLPAPPSTQPPTPPIPPPGILEILQRLLNDPRNCEVPDPLLDRSLRVYVIFQAPAFSLFFPEETSAIHQVLYGPHVVSLPFRL